MPVPVHAVADDQGNVGEGLHVVEDGGLAPQALLNGAGRLHPGHAALALDGGGQGAALAADEGACAPVHMDAEVKAAAQDVIPQQAQLLGLGNGGFQPGHSQGILGPDVDIALVAAGGQARDHHALQHGMGVALHNGAVHEGAGVALVAVADDILDRRILAAGGEAAAAPAPEAGVDDVPADLLIRHLEQGTLEAGVAALGDVLLDVLGVAGAAVLQHHPVLLLIERNVLLPGIGHAVQTVHQAVDDLAAQNGLFQDLVAVLGLDVDVHDAHGLDVDQGTHLAEAVAAAHLDVQALFLVGVVLEADVHRQIPAFALGPEVFIDLHGAAGDAAGTGADQHRGGLLAAAQGPLGLIAQVAERVAGELHWAASSFRIFSSSSRALVGDILAWTSPSTVITGARPQAPRQATVSRVNMPSSLVLRLPDRPRYS